MNVVMIMCDELSGSMIGKPQCTPNLDSLASSGSLFENAYTTCPLCAPARASWFTGKYVNRIGTWDNSTPYDGKVAVGMAEYLETFGIPFTQIGKTHFHHEGEYHFEFSDELGLLRKTDNGCFYRKQNVERIGAEKRFTGISISDDSRESFDDRVLASSLKWLEKHGNDKSPWVLSIGFTEPHFPFHVRRENYDMFADIKVPEQASYTSLNNTLNELRHYFRCDLATEDVTRKILRGYHAAARELDEKIGKILRSLRENGLENNTAVIFTSDHGEQGGEHGLWWKCCMFEASSRIPLIIRAPGKSLPQIYHDPVSITDIFPTVCDMMGIPVPEDIDGESLYSHSKDYAFGEYNGHGTSSGMYMIRWRQWKFIYYTNDPPQLFDLENDPGENSDLFPLMKDSLIVKECMMRLFSVCNPAEVTDRSLHFQESMRKALHLPEEYTIERGGDFVPHPKRSGSDQ